MIGAELADRVSPVSMLRPELLIEDGSQSCWVCDASYTSCSHSDFDLNKVEAETVAPTQGQAKRGPGRPPKAKAAAKPAEPAPEAPVTSSVPPVEPEIAPAGSAPTETVSEPSAASPAPVEPPPVRPPGPIGSDFGRSGVQTLSPVAPDVADPSAVPRVRAQDVDAGQDGDIRDVLDVPQGFMHPREDPHCPAAVLVSDPSLIMATGAWRTMASGTTVELTQEIQQAVWMSGMRAPTYRMLAAKGSVMPKPV